ncbi:MAG TPA: HEPN domain-containing protein [Pirellulales bacterium]
MPAPKNPQITILREWLAKADDDLAAARQIQKLGKAAPTSTVCFHAQQCVEKYLKALLIQHGTPFAKTHDIAVLMSLLPGGQRPLMTTKEQQEFTSYAVVTRYPQAGIVISPRQARTALQAARRIRRDVRRLLPTAALRREK